MNDNIRYFLYGLVAVFGLLLWNDWQRETVVPPQSATQGAIVSASSVSIPVSGGAISNPSGSGDINTSQTQQKGQLINVKTDEFSILIDKKGGHIVRADLLKYSDKAGSKTPFVLLNNLDDDYYVEQSGFTVNLNNVKLLDYNADQQNYIMEDGKNELIVKLSASLDSKVKTNKTYVFKRGSYAVQINNEIVNSSNKPWNGSQYLQLIRHVNQENKKELLKGVASFVGVAYSEPNSPYNKISFSDMKKNQVDKTIKSGWIAMLQHYFIGAFVPDKSIDYRYFALEKGDDTYLAGMVSPAFDVSSNSSKAFSSNLYVGPKIANNLEAIAPHLSLTIDYGWLWIIAQPIFWLLKQIHSFIGNWGWAIIFVTLFIKLLFYKLSDSSYKSMAAMKRIQPKIEQLKERYGEDKNGMSKATMELYQREKINPLGGCLPILIQIPVFIALYWVLLESVELRQAPFILWIYDLSARDPYYVLPVLMGLSMFAQQRLSPQPPDQMQAKMMMFLPVVLTVLFLNFPTGLMLYWIVNNGLSILQQWYITKKYSDTPKQKNH